MTNAEKAFYDRLLVKLGEELSRRLPKSLSLASNLTTYTHNRRDRQIRDQVIEGNPNQAGIPLQRYNSFHDSVCTLAHTTLSSKTRETE